MRKTRRMRAAEVLSACAAAGLVAAGCGSDDFENKPRPPVPLQLTGVITEERVTISPRKVGAGPVVITVSNQTKQSHTLTLESQGEGNVRETVGPVIPRDTAAIQRTLTPGQYVVKAGSEAAVEREVAPATLVIGQPRPSAKDDLLLP